MNDPKPDPEWLTPETREHIRRAAYAFHVRAFGEELARVNFLPLEERRRYVGEMVDHARRRGVNLERPARGVTP
jgi:hypothetical protein